MRIIEGVRRPRGQQRANHRQADQGDVTEKSSGRRVTSATCATCWRCRARWRGPSAGEVGITLTPQEGARLAQRTGPVESGSAPAGSPRPSSRLPRRPRKELRKAIQYFDAAIAKDPENALAHAGLAEAYSELSGFYVHPREAMPKAKQAAETAMRLDESLADAHATLGFIHLVYDWDGPAAEKELLRALDLNPTLALARLRYAAYLASQARHDESVREDAARRRARPAVGHGPTRSAACS